MVFKFQTGCCVTSGRIAFKHKAGWCSDFRQDGVQTTGKLVAKEDSVQSSGRMVFRTQAEWCSNLWEEGVETSGMMVHRTPTE